MYTHTIYFFTEINVVPIGCLILLIITVSYIYLPSESNLCSIICMYVLRLLVHSGYLYKIYLHFTFERSDLEC